MFTGIVHDIGEIIRAEKTGGGVKLSVRSPGTAAQLAINDSVAIDGVCQTVIAKTTNDFTVEAVEETLKKTTLGIMRLKSKVHLELPVRLSDRLGGHLVLGHVDTVGTVRSIAKQESSWLLTIDYSPEFSRYLIPVGSIAVDGVSLTIASLYENSFVVSLIPHTLQKTNFSDITVNQKINLEFDVLGKYVERLLQKKSEGEITKEKLHSWGFET